MNDKNFMSYGDAETVFTEFADNINSKEPQIFKGTVEEWDALTAEEQAKYTVRCHPDIDTGDVVDAVTDGDLRAVSSNAVYDALSDKQNGLKIETQYINGTNGGDWALADNKLYETSFSITVPTGYKLLFCIVSTAWTNSHLYFGECYCPAIITTTSGKVGATCENAPSAGSIALRGLCVFAKA